MGSIFDKLHNININVAGDVIDLRGGTYNKGCTIINQPSQPSPKPQHIEDAAIVEEVKDIVTTSEEPSPEVNTTEDDSQAVILQKRQKALDMIMKCESFFKSNTQQIIQQAFDQLCEDKYAHLDEALSGQSFNTTVCRMIGVALDENLFETKKKRDLGKCVEEKEMSLSLLTAEKYIGNIHETPQQGLLKLWRKYLQTKK
jgi:hypothetical protein